MEPASVSQVLTSAAALLLESGVEAPRLSARLILGHVLGVSQEHLLAHPELQLDSQQLEQFKALTARRLAGEPVAYIVGSKEFYGLDFMVTRDVLIPRPETELIVDHVLSFFQDQSGLVLADLGTGSGILAVTLCLNLPGSRCLACDISPAALKVAVMNALKHQTAHRTLFFLSDLAQAVRPGSLDLLVSNPPYLSRKDFDQAPHHVTAFEPEIALLSQDNGLGHIRFLEKSAAITLKPGGMIVLEMGTGQAEDVAGIFQAWSGQRVIRDLAGHDRLFQAFKP
ncbi:MAG: peptide chain release factor N(5)-glutamine methyltransferase [Desulfonatronovibrio sp.]